MSTFNGYPQEAFTFFEGLTQNLDREWFEAHKSDYYDYVHKPTQDFVLALGARMQKVIAGVEYDEKRSLMRIYRDIRFSKDKTPYKTYQGFIVWEGARSKPKENPAFHFGLVVDGLGIHAGMHGFDKAMLQGYRDAVVDDKLGAELAKILESIKAEQYEIGGEKGKRVPNGYDKAHPRADLLLYKGLWVDTPKILPAVATSPQLIDAVMVHVEKLAPLHHWLVKIDPSTE